MSAVKAMIQEQKLKNDAEFFKKVFSVITNAINNASTLLRRMVVSLPQLEFRAQSAKAVLSRINKTTYKTVANELVGVPRGFAGNATDLSTGLSRLNYGKELLEMLTSTNEMISNDINNKKILATLSSVPSKAIMNKLESFKNDFTYTDSALSDALTISEVFKNSADIHTFLTSAHSHIVDDAEVRAMVSAMETLSETMDGFVEVLKKSNDKKRLNTIKTLSLRLARLVEGYGLMQYSSIVVISMANEVVDLLNRKT